MADNDQQLIGLLSELRDPFGRLPNIIIDFYGPGMKQAGWLYSLFVRFSKFDDSTTFVGLKTLEDTSGLDLKTVLRYTEHLENLGVIKVWRDKTARAEKRRPKPNVYTLVLPPFPPPPEIVSNYFPKNWTPPERALKALKNIRNYLDFTTTPQGIDEKRGDTGKIPVMVQEGPGPAYDVPGTTPVTQVEKEPLPSTDSGTAPDTHSQDASKVLASRQTNKPSLTRDIYQEEKTVTTSKQDPFVCTETFINQLISEARTLDKTIGRDQLRTFINQAAKKENNVREKVEERLWQALQAAKEYKARGGHISDFRRWYMTAVVNAFKPNGQVNEQEDQAETVSEYDENTALNYEDILFTFDLALNRLGPGGALKEYREKLKTHPDWERAEKEIILKYKFKIEGDGAEYKSFEEYTLEDILDSYERCLFLGTHERKMNLLRTNFSKNANWEKANVLLEKKSEKGVQE